MDDVSPLEVSKLWLPLLNSDNYFMWCRKLELVLRGKGLWQIASEEEGEPSRESENWKSLCRRKDIALSTVLLLVDESCIAQVIDKKDPCKVWKELVHNLQLYVKQAGKLFLTNTKRQK